MRQAHILTEISAYKLVKSTDVQIFQSKKLKDLFFAPPKLVRIGRFCYTENKDRDREGSHMKKTLLLLAEGFEEVEALTVVDLLRRADIVCDMAALGDSIEVSGSHGIAVRADRLLSDAENGEYDGVILPGGLRGTENLAADGRVAKLLRRYRDEGKAHRGDLRGPDRTGCGGTAGGKARGVLSGDGAAALRRGRRRRGGRCGRQRDHEPRSGDGDPLCPGADSVSGQPGACADTGQGHRVQTLG